MARYPTPTGQIAGTSSHINTASPAPYQISTSPNTIGVGIGGSAASVASAPVSSTGIVANNQHQNMRSPTLVSPISANQLPLASQQQILRPQDLPLQHQPQSTSKSFYIF